jgi:hypothetical protein
MKQKTTKARQKKHIKNHKRSVTFNVKLVGKLLEAPLSDVIIVLHATLCVAPAISTPHRPWNICNGSVLLEAHNGLVQCWLHGPASAKELKHKKAKRMESPQTPSQQAQTPGTAL